jgi:hypothetical protein
MQNPPRIWLDYRPVRIGWVLPDRDIARLATVASWNACLWGGRSNCLIPLHDSDLAQRLVTCFAVDVLIPAEADAASAAFVARFPHLEHHRCRLGIFHEHSCDFADIRHALRRMDLNHDERSVSQLLLPVWEAIALIRQVLTPGVWSRVVKLPLTMMATARRLQAHAPNRAAVTAQLAVAIAILAAAPVRPRQSERDQAWDQLDQARRAGLKLLARLSGL